ncbi:unnamed protein product [Ilex paraguariensis]|uniref:Uncharacterized protein n=1 Tax=Ilex paraguariensis TaxID=185542 RepID=A0ABC8RAN5_9AQUA
MEGGAASEKQNAAGESTTASYTYWVREVTQDAAPLPVPRKLTPQDLSSHSQSTNHLGSAWNRDSLFFR